ncbi:MAG: peptide chain release factor 1 [Candidatus Brocadiia bacterium]
MTGDFDILPLTEPAAVRLRELEQRLASPGVSSSPDYAGLLKEHGTLLKIVTARNEVLELRKQIEECTLMLEGGDPEMTLLAKEELPELTKRQDKLIGELEERMILGDEDSERSVIVEIRAGTGGEEAGLFAGDLFRMYVRYAEKMGWKTEILDAHRTEHDGFREVVFSIQGDGVYKALRYEGGGHRVQRVPETEASGRIHTSAATVAILPEVDEVDINIRPDDLRIDTFSAGGPGGQHVNKTQSAVRITHIPSGTVVVCQDERSQHKNKARAMRILRARVYEAQREARDRERSAARKEMIGTGERSDRVRTYNFPQNRVTDHRAEITLYALDRVMGGEIEPLISALLEYDKHRRIERLTKDMARDPSLLLKR